jgi:hypothetical protein
MYVYLCRVEYLFATRILLDLQIDPLSVRFFNILLISLASMTSPNSKNYVIASASFSSRPLKNSKRLKSDSFISISSSMSELNSTV